MTIDHDYPSTYSREFLISSVEAKEKQENLKKKCFSYPVNDVFEKHQTFPFSMYQ
jgi:hypothetical protein